MTKVRVIINERSNSAKIHTYYPINTQVKDEGRRKPNQFVGTFSKSNIVKEGDLVSYVQDMADVEALRAIYNFQLSALDEGGYDQDPSTDPPSSHFTQVTTQKYTGFYALEFLASTFDGVVVDTVDNIDISGQFDIFVSFTPDRTQENDGGDEPIMWSFYEGGQTLGLEIGISGTNGSDSSWRGFARIGNGSITQTITGLNETIMNDSSGNADPVLIRVFRGQDNVIRMEVNGEEDVSLSVTQSLQPIGADMIFGDGNAQDVSKEYVGLLHQVRVYCGDTLPQSQAQFIRWSKPIPSSMKFRGRIYRTKDNEVSTTVYAQSNSYEILSGTLGGDSGDATDFVTHDLTDETYEFITQTAVNNAILFNTITVKVLDTFAFDNVTSTLPSPQSGDIIEVGSFLDFINILLVMSFTTFHITPRNIMIIETDSGKQTNYIFEQNTAGTNVAAPYNITVNEEDDINMANDITLISSQAGKVRRFSSPNDIKRALRKNVEQLSDSGMLDNYATRLRFILSDEGAANPVARSKHIVKITSLLNSIRSNQIVNIINNQKNIDLNEIIMQITYSYPSEHLIINTGEVDLDYYDNIEKTIVKSDELVDSTLS